MSPGRNESRIPQGDEKWLNLKPVYEGANSVPADWQPKTTRDSHTHAHTFTARFGFSNEGRDANVLRFLIPAGFVGQRHRSCPRRSRRGRPGPGRIATEVLLSRACRTPILFPGRFSTA